MVTCPDVALAASQMAQFHPNPSPIHLAAADRVISYLNATQRSLSTTPRVKRTASSSTPVTPHLRRIQRLKRTPMALSPSRTEARLTEILRAITAVTGPPAKSFGGYGSLNTEQAATISCDNQQTIRLLTQEGPKARYLQAVETFISLFTGCAMGSQARQSISITSKRPKCLRTVPSRLSRAQKHEIVVKLLYIPCRYCPVVDILLPAD